MKSLKNATVLLLLICTLSLTSCGHISDTNGEDTSLCSITERELFAKINSYTQFGAVSSSFGNSATYKVSKLSGIYSVAKFSAEGKSLTLKTSAELKSGNARIVILNNGNYIGDIPLTNSKTTVIDSPSGKYEIRIAGESAKINFSMEYTLE